MRIRKSESGDLARIMEIYSYARNFMAEHGNPNQWGPTNWPPEKLIEKDISEGKSYVCLCEPQNHFEKSEEIVGTFFYDCGHSIEPTYDVIEDGSWIGDEDYGVVHRVASDGTVKGTGSFCVNWAFDQCGHLRMDTHGDNKVMQSMLEKLGFVHCGTIYVEEDDYPRLAYEKMGF